MCQFINWQYHTFKPLHFLVYLAILLIFKNHYIMKKSNLKSLRLNKKLVSSFNPSSIQGGRTNNGCYDSFQRTCPAKCMP